jgi:hypothetical protein
MGMGKLRVRGRAAARTENAAEDAIWRKPRERLAYSCPRSLCPPSRLSAFALSPPMHYDAHQPIIADLEARILTIRDSL